MTTTFRKSFARDLKKIKNQNVRDRVRQVIAQVEAATELQAIDDLKKLSGAEGFFRIRIGDHRIGLFLEDETVEFVRCLNRRDLYRYFP
jgi:mRNA interferase RelE/StbE